jgi:CubicO group peptidase (beta-lactamase class C family)
MKKAAILLTLLIVVSLAVLLSFLQRQRESARCESAETEIAEIECRLEALRKELRIPGLSAAVAKDGAVIWSRGFGFADRERGIRADAGSIYQLASVTKPYAAAVVLQLVEEGRLDLDAPVSAFGIEMDGGDAVRVRHLLSHTAGPPPGSHYRYDGRAFAELGRVIASVTGKPFEVELTERIIRPLELGQTAPNPHDAGGALANAGLERAPIERKLVKEYARAWGRTLWPSGLFGPMREIAPPTSFHAAAGLVASAPDVARFSTALDSGELLGEEMHDLSMRPVVTPSGEVLPYAHGWFVQEHEGLTLVWHHGHWFGSSSLLVRIPERQLTFVVLANSDGLSRWRGLGDHGDLSRSAAARSFLGTFVSALAAQ